jgi:OmpA family
MRKFSVFTLVLFMVYLINANSESYDFSKSQAFRYDSSENVEITEKCYDYLKALSSYLKANPGMVVRIKGHSDNAGTFDQNEDRAYKRATFIFNYLMNEGVEADRIYARGVGSRMPLADNDKKDGRFINRRVEIEIDNTQMGGFPNREVAVTATGAAAAAATKASSRKAPTSAKQAAEHSPKVEAKEDHSSHEDHADAHHSYHPWHLAIFNGATTTFDPSHTSYTLGVELEYRFPVANGEFGIGIFDEIIFTEDPEYVIGAGFFCHPTGGLKFMFGAGTLFAKHAASTEEVGVHSFYNEKENQMLASTEGEAEYHSYPFMRLGVGYDIHIGSFAISPLFNADFLNHGKVALNYGVALGIGF